MKQIFKKGISISLAVLLLLTAAPLAGFVGLELPAIDFCLPAQAEEVVASGNCGENVTYVLDSDGTLTISGTGDMKFYNSSSSVPWYYNRSSIKTIVVEYGVTNIAYYAFCDCSSLTAATIGDSVTSIGYYAFDNCTSLNAVHISNLATWCKIDFPHCYSNPLYYAKKLYLNGTLLTELTIPDNVTRIGEFAFFDYTLLTSVTIPDSVTTIGDYAFSDCTSLISVTIPDSVISIGPSAFRDCTALTEITIPNNVTSIGWFAFDGCSALSSVSIPVSVTSIDERAFYNCTSLGEITILNPECTIYDSSTTITSSTIIRGYENSTAQDYAEKYNRTFVSLSGNNDDVIYSGYAGENADFTIIRDGTMTITGTGAMYDYNGSDCPWHKYAGFIKSVSIAEGITSIGDYNFYDCLQLPTVDLPDSIARIGQYAFENCKSLATVNMSTNLTKIATAAFSGCSSLTSIAIPNSVNSIGWYAFRECTSLNTVTIGNNVKSIEAYAFQYCSALSSIIIPNNVNSIGSDTFRYCNALTSITILNPDCSITDYGTTIPEHTTIIGYDNSTAKSYARKYNRTFIELEPVWTMGDLDGDEKITSSDARTALRASVGLETLTDAQTAAADTDGNGEITSSDARSILRAAVGLDNPEDWIANIN